MNVHDTLFLKMISSSLTFCVASYLIFEETSLCHLTHRSINQTHVKSNMITGSRFHVRTLVCTHTHTHTHRASSFYFRKASFSMWRCAKWFNQCIIKEKPPQDIMRLTIAFYLFSQNVMDKYSFKVRAWPLCWWPPW